MSIEWSQSLSVSIAEIDEQHKKLIAMINDLGAGMKAGKGKEVLGPVLNKLISYTGEHFTYEERLFDQHGYAAKASHKLEHTNFVKKIADFKKGFEAGTAMVSIDVMNFLSDWLKNHIMKTDMSYSQFLNGKGVK